MPKSEEARFDGKHWIVDLPFTEDGVDRLLMLMTFTGDKSRSKCCGQALVELMRYWGLAEKGINFYAQLGNHLERFDFIDDPERPLFAKSIQSAQFPFMLKMGPKAHEILAKVADRMKVPAQRALYNALLYYEWHVRRLMTGHVMLVGKLGELIKPKPDPQPPSPPKLLPE